MHFEIDEQTIQDLELFPGSHGHMSIFACFDYAKTQGGRSKLLKLFKNPSNDIENILKQVDAIKFLLKNPVNLGFRSTELDFIEHYLSHKAVLLRTNLIDAFIHKARNVLSPTNDYFVISQGLSYVQAHMLNLKRVADEISLLESKSGFVNEFVSDINRILDKPAFSKFLLADMKSWNLSPFDRLLREESRDDVDKILLYTYMFDAFESVSEACRQKGLSFATYTNDNVSKFKAKGIFHLLLSRPVANDINLEGENNLCFLTGANMSGKSTFLKSIGVCIYLAHIGFPVPAHEMEMTLFDGFFSTLNLTDDLQRGYSHFYSEVKRVKDVLERIRDGKQVVVIFDELFRGTNVKDSFDGTLLVTRAFSRIKSCMFFVSTHIIEVGIELTNEKGVLFKCFRSTLINSSSEYNYKLMEGVSTERLGLSILKNEGIVQLVDEILESKTDTEEKSITQS